MSSRPLTASCNILTILFVLLVCTAVHAPSTASIKGQVTDRNCAVVAAVDITALSLGLKGQKVFVQNGKITDYRINLRVTFLSIIKD
jgi:type 1 fimbria pilin